MCNGESDASMCLTQWLVIRTRMSSYAIAPTHSQPLRFGRRCGSLSHCLSDTWTYDWRRLLLTGRRYTWV
jgi:hypothetical protein